MWYIYTMKYYSVIKKKAIMPFVVTCMDLEIIILSKVSQEETDTIYHLYVASKTWHTNLSTTQKADSQTQRTDLWFPRVGEVKEGWIGSLELADENLYRMDKQQSPTV